MAKIKILGIQTHYKLKKNRKTGEEVFYMGGVDYARLHVPLMNLPKDEFEVKIIPEPKDPEKLTKYYDIIYSSYIDTDIVYVKIKVNAIKNKCEWVLDLDDNIWNVHPSHPYYKDFKDENSMVLKKETLILKDATYLTTTNSQLRYKMADKLAKRVPDIHVIPNYIDLTDYDYKKIPKVKKKGIQIGYIGGSSHFDDINKSEFVNALKIIFDKYPNVTFKTTFYMPSLKALFGNRYKYTLGRYNVFTFIDEVWTQMSAESDIFVAPLTDTPYSRCKSYIKFLEYSASKRPSIMEKIRPYNEISGDHMLQASRTEDWVKHLESLIEDEAYRKELGEKAYKYVKDNHTIQKNIHKMADYFKSVI